MFRQVLVACVLAVSLHDSANGQAATATRQTPHRESQPGVVFVSGDDFTRPWAALFSQAFRDVLMNADEAPTLHLETLDLPRFEDVRYADALAGWLQDKYRSRRVDVVVAIGEEALTFLAQRPGRPWPGASVIYVEVGGVPKDVSHLLPGATGVILGDHTPRAIDVVKQVLPGTTHVAIVAGATNVEDTRFGGFADKVRKAGLEPVVLSKLALADAVTAVARLPPHAVVFILAPVVDGSGRVLPPARPCAAISATATVPTFSLGYQDFGCGVVGGLMRDWTVIGRLVGEQTLARLRHPLPAVVPVPDGAFTTLAFDQRQLQRWGIAETRLPAGSSVQFRRVSLWRDYRGLSLSVASVVALQGGLIAVLVMERQRRRRAEFDARKHLLAMAHLDRRAALGQLTSALAHELHQPLAAILRNTEAATMQLTAGRSTTDELLEIMGDIKRDDKRAATIIRRLRSLLEKHELEDGAVDLHDVVVDTVALATSEATSRNVRMDVALDADRHTVTGDRVHLQQVLLNLLLNGLDAVSAMSAERRRLVVQSSSDASWVEVRVVDNGPGLPEEIAGQMFEPFVTTKSSNRGAGLGLGLSIARSIVEAHGGRMHARNNEREGATVVFALPHRRPEASGA